MASAEKSKEIKNGHEQKLQKPPTLLTEKEIEAGDKAFVELVKARDKMIAEAKRAKGILDDDH